MSVISIAGQRWIAKTVTYKIPGGVTTKPYPVEVLDEIETGHPQLTGGNLRIYLHYYTPGVEAASVVLGTVIGGALNSIVKFLPTPPNEDQVIPILGSILGGSLNSIVRNTSVEPEAINGGLGTMLGGTLNTIIVVFYTKGLPEAFQVSLMGMTGGSLNE